MSMADDMIDGMFEEMFARERYGEESDREIEQQEVEGYLHDTPLPELLGDTRKTLESLEPWQREQRLPTTAQSIFIQGLAGRKLSDKQINALGLFVVRYGE
ncbi:hypothetical protein CPT_Moonbeam15 [Bacillus phage Moonbeam]|uniref:Uncharacterized protein n=1 Tax=Bacillus phage Moonbeam TaxID=1540091 RepID=A0A0A0RUZ3_9CAUD|nr:hypothetical protein CPT_Moonbeam15 [Bacillus phage Moonbeam]AIW03413.1 hypothetical protein CPT_Moonbeam15 [Bacillus phage Moonbeam]